MKKVLVTGGSGWLGAAVVRRLLSQGDDVVSVDLLVNPEMEALAKQKTRLENRVADLTDSDSIREVVVQAKPDAVIHCGAIVGVLQCADIPAKVTRVNVEGMANLLEAMRIAGVGRMVHVSTEETYGDFETSVISEDHPQRPTSVYGLTKLAAENFARVYSRNHGIECIHVRTCWVYGPNLPRPRMPKTYVDAALRGESLIEPCGGDFAVDQVYIDDTVSGLVLALNKPDHRFDTYNVATGVAPTLGDVAELVNASVPGSSIRIEPGPYYLDGKILSARKGALDISRARKELGYEPQFPIERGIALIIEEARKARG
ncbi:NAD-dependent epimerase/dehydratase family protein [Hwanghaeella sp.]|uniref:NAD-dependent epimerase/dehydratase family protein n=1 Tax=Hwanghaeella sp. TaxID=2605943 RepID=UPI003CCB8269